MTPENHPRLGPRARCWLRGLPLLVLLAPAIGVCAFWIQEIVTPPNAGEQLEAQVLWLSLLVGYLYAGPAALVSSLVGLGVATRSSITRNAPARALMPLGAALGVASGVVLAWLLDGGGLWLLAPGAFTGALLGGLTPRLLGRPYRALRDRALVGPA